MKLPDWQSRMAAVVKEYQRAAPVWGEHDCCLFAADCIRALTDIDPMAEFRGHYSTPIEAYALVDSLGFDEFSALVEHKFKELGFPEIAPVFAQRGDIGMVLGPRRDNTLGVCLGEKFAFMGDGPMQYLDRQQIIKSWRIG